MGQFSQYSIRFIGFFFHAPYVFNSLKTIFHPLNFNNNKALRGRFLHYASVSTVCYEAIWPSIFLTQIGCPFSIAKLHKESPPMFSFFQSCRYFAWFFQKNKILLENTQKKSKFCTLKSLKKVAMALDKNWYKAWFLTHFGYRKSISYLC